jgi:two-component system cell cycle response regulator DivK
MSDKGTILYIEDNSDNRSLVRRVLGADEYTVDEAKNAAEALNYLETKTPALILMDISMPDMDGYTLTGKIRAIPKFAKTPIIAMTANVMRGDRERSLEAGCDGYIQKPIDIDTLTQQVERFIQRNSND